MNKKWMPIAAGIFEILAGFWMLVSEYFLIGFAETSLERWDPSDFLLLSILFILGVLAVVGGVFALMRRKWRIAVAGAAGIVLLPFITASVLAAVVEYGYNISRWYIFGLEILLAISPIALLLLSKREFK
jgi:hypothetical protein